MSETHARYTCCDSHRRARVEAHPTLNGIDWLEVLDRASPPGSPRQQTLLLRLIKPVPAGLTRDNLRLEGGERIRGIAILWLGIASAPPAEATPAEQALFASLPAAERVLVIRADSSGDHSRYRLRLVRSVADDDPPADFDPRLVEVDFSFKVECPSDFDCRPEHDCSTQPLAAPDLNLLARDFESLRRLLLDRLAQRMPGWRDRSPADLVTTLAELIAYVGDLQHYELDAVTTEAYLATARLRSSLRRHALLVDYALHDGCNARAWLHIEVDEAGGGPFALPAGIRFTTRGEDLAPRLVPDSDAARRALAAAQVFEPVLLPAAAPIMLHAAHNRFAFHSWGDSRCCLPAGATAATLRGHWPALARGDVLVLQEVLGPRTGLAADADPAHRHAVRLTRVRALNGAAPLTDPLDGTEITEIAWHAGDALPFALCISSVTDEAHGSRTLDDVSVALGNIILVDHGLGIDAEALGSVPEPLLAHPARPAACDPEAPQPLPVRFRPTLAEGPLTRRGMVACVRIEHGLRRTEWLPFDSEAAATAAMRWPLDRAAAQIELESMRDSAPPQHWRARRDLFASNASDTHFVVETEADGTTRLRFGFAPHGQRPESGSTFTARYRVGNGPAGNVGAQAIAHAITADARIVAVDNPLPAQGGVAPETMAEVRRRAPHAFRTQARAVTPADYAEVTGRLSGVQRAAATQRWTGSWHTMFVTVDRSGGARVDAGFADSVVAHLEPFRMAGHDLRVDDPVPVSLEIALLVCVADGHFRSDVRRGLLAVLGSRMLPNGQRGLFHPDNFSFGQTVYLSPLYAAARTVAGVRSVEVRRFTRQGQDDPKPLADGFMRLGRLEIARLANDPNHPEHGVLRLELHGGK